MQRARAIAGGMLVLASVCLAPAVTAAQDAATTTDATATTTTASPPLLPVPTTSPTPPDAPSAEADAGDPREAANQSRTANPPLADSAPADASAGGVSSSAGGAVAHKSASVSVTMGDFFFSPASVSVAVGDTVTWRNTGQAPHNATADDGSFKTPDLNNGGSASHTFNSPGTFSYICTIHPNMKGTVRVLASSSGGSGGKKGGSGGSAGSVSSGSATSEAAAVASPDAAGSSTNLPATGMAAGALALVGFVLLASGLLARQAERRARRGWYSPF